MKNALIIVKNAKIMNPLVQVATLIVFLILIQITVLAYKVLLKTRPFYVSLAISNVLSVKIYKHNAQVVLSIDFSFLNQIHVFVM